MSDAINTGAKRKITESEREEINAYACAATPFRGSSRSRVDQQAHEWMEAELRSWQASEGKGDAELPYGNDWFLLKRVACIKANLVTRTHSDDVVKSYLKSYVKRVKKERSDNGGDAPDAGAVDTPQV